MSRILVVDDSGFSRRLLRKILEQAGHDVLEAADGLTALERYAVERPDAVVLDLTMPDISGFDLLPQLLSFEPPARVLVATADIQTSVQRWVSETGAGFVAKPFVAEQVLNGLNIVLGQPGGKAH